jgi:hypothetical protein
MCRTHGRVLVIGALFALILTGLIPMFLMAPTSDVMTAEPVGSSLSIGSRLSTSREVAEINSAIGIRQDGKDYNTLIDGFGTGLAPPSSQQLVEAAGTAPAANSVTPTGLIATASVTSHSDEKEVVGATGIYSVRALNAAASSASSNSISLAVKGSATVPGAPSGGSAVGSDCAIHLSWSSSTDGGSAITGYKVYRSTVPGSEKLLVTVGTTTSYSNTGLTNGKTYYYRLSAVNAAGEGCLGPEISGMPSVTSALPRPFSLTATPVSGYVQLSWTGPALTTTWVSFDIMRTESGIERTIATVPGTMITYHDQTAVPGKDYTYRIVARSAFCSTSTPSAYVHVTSASAGEKVTLNLGQPAGGQLPIWFYTLLASIAGTIGVAAFYRLRRHQA